MSAAPDQASEPSAARTAQRFQKFSQPPRVFVTRRLPQQVETRMAELFEVTLNLEDRPLSRAELQAAVARCDVLVPTVTDEIDADLLAGAGEGLRLIANFGAGYDHVDVHAAKARGIIVTNTPGVLDEDTADLAMALILAVPRRMAEGHRRARSGDWQGWTPTHMLGHRIGGKRLGIVGMGRIGQAIATRARGFGLAIHYHNRKRLPAAVEAPLEATWWPTLDAMLERVDIISLNCPDTAATHQMINARRLRLMQRHAYLINVARGGLIDEQALIETLQRGGIAGAGLDVFAAEPEIPAALLALPNVIVLPHMASATFEGRQAMGEKVIANIRTFVDGHRPPDQILVHD